MTLAEVVAAVGAPRQAVLGVLVRLTEEGSVIEGDLLPDKPGPQYCWALRWRKAAGRRAPGAARRRPSGVGRPEAAARRDPDIDSELVRAFHSFIINEYTPPKDKRLLVLLQCSVRRPFSKSPSHGSMRRAVAVATGHDPAREFDACPAHVVVLASRIGPVPYELEDFYPANIRGGGLKHFGHAHYARVKPILAGRMAQYITTHRGSYDHIAGFGDGRYAEVMTQAATAAGVDLPVFPDTSGPRIMRMGESTPRTYWQRYWIQLYLQIVQWLSPAMQAEAARRLKALKAIYR